MHFKTVLKGNGFPLTRPNLLMNFVREIPVLILQIWR